MFRVSYFATKVQKSQQIAKHSNKKIWLAFIRQAKLLFILHDYSTTVLNICSSSFTFGSESKHSLHSLNHDLLTIDDVDALHLATVILQVRRVIRQLATQEIVDTTLATDGLQLTHLSITHVCHITPLHVN